MKGEHLEVAASVPLESAASKWRTMTNFCTDDSGGGQGHSGTTTPATTAYPGRSPGENSASTSSSSGDGGAGFANELVGGQESSSTCVRR